MARPPSLDAAPPPLPWGGTQPHDGAAAHLTDDIVAAALEAVGVQASNPPSTPPPPVDALLPQDDEELIDDDEEPASPAQTPSPAPPAVQEESSISVDLEASPPRVRMRTTPATYGEDYRRHLRNSGLFLAGIALGTRGRPVQVELTLPSGTVIRCAAQVVASLPSGTGLMLALTRSDRDQLAAEAG